MNEPMKAKAWAEQYDLTTLRIYRCIFFLFVPIFSVGVFVLVGVGVWVAQIGFGRNPVISIGFLLFLFLAGLGVPGAVWVLVTLYREDFGSFSRLFRRKELGNE